MQQLIELSQEIGQQQIENRYLRECYKALKILQESTADMIMVLDELFESQTQESMTPIYTKIFRLQEKTCQLTTRMDRAQEACEELCPLHMSCSVHQQLEPIIRMIIDQRALTAHAADFDCESLP
ncbi:hypothetical protein N7478_003806 [Penicillium angulare]|uniref:uncharacterized protein n=1 Tax=Penicillium angulare TaxID=116970 RepID=UPI00254129FB|nr:uncharacterized protein N7478_003806 [Penicillium angulare]KAJ5288120.1 hypothetical protein N7478_003806 [Penicillium angulare]